MSAPPVLAIDTSGASGWVGLASISHDTMEVTCVAQVELGVRAAAAQLMPAVVLLLEQAELALADLRAIVVVHGPGSFTGLRVALSTAKGLAHATGVPLVAVSRLAVLAALSQSTECLALLDAGRGEFYAGEYRGGVCRREWLASAAEVEAYAEQGGWLVAAEDAVAARLARWSPEPVGPLDACAAVRAARDRVLAGTWDDLRTLDANYLRHSAEQLFARAAVERR